MGKLTISLCTLMSPCLGAICRLSGRGVIISSVLSLLGHLSLRPLALILVCVLNSPECKGMLALFRRYVESLELRVRVKALRVKRDLNGGKQPTMTAVWKNNVSRSCWM